jgi:DNA-binding SARP family transcriptional activator
VDIHLLGAVELRAGDRALPAGRPQQQTVLAVLAAGAGSLVPVDTVVARVWGGSIPNRVRRTLHTHICGIRRTLEQAVRLEGAPVRLTHRADGYVLEIDPDHVDLHRFRRLSDRGRDHRCTPQERVGCLRQAMALWQGEPLAGLRGEWAERMRQDWRQQHLAAVMDWARAELLVDNPTAVLWPLTSLIGDHPLVEPLTALLMRALCTLGRTAEALDRCADIRGRLMEELGTDPGTELRDLHLAILRGGCTAPSAPSQSFAAQQISAQLPLRLRAAGLLDRPLTTR